MHQYSPDADALRSNSDTAQRVSEKVSSQTLAGVVSVNRQAANHGQGDGIRGIAADFAGGS